MCCVPCSRDSENRGIGSVDGVKKQERRSKMIQDFQQIHRQRRRGILKAWKSRICLPERVTKVISYVRHKFYFCGHKRRWKTGQPQGYNLGVYRCRTCETVRETSP